jgi:hypothetical protein
LIGWERKIEIKAEYEGLNMKKITDKEYEEYQAYKRDLIKGRVLTTNGIKLIIEANDYNPTEIGKDILKGYYKSIS